MTEINGVIAALYHAAPAYLYLALFFFAFLENLFPPSPSDLVVAFGGALVGFGKLNIIAAILFATLGSTAGFVLMYYVGFIFGRELVDSGKLKFLPLEKIKTVEGWFTKYGYWMVVGNRFLSGTRAVISFFVGLSKLPIVITLPLCAMSALLWNTLLVFTGSQLGHNWRKLEYYLDIYGTIVVAIVVFAAVYFILKYFYKRKHV
ncbi:MAG: DedA family protein [Candidatus Kryptoniota bacterium]